jgi:hypothetical protein
MSWRSGPRIRFSPRSQRVVEGAAWLLPIAALCLLSYGSLLRAFGLPPSLGPIQLGAPVVVGAVAWLIASRSIHPTRSTILAGILLVAALALVPELLRRTTHDVVPLDGSRSAAPTMCGPPRAGRASERRSLRSGCDRWTELNRPRARPPPATRSMPRRAVGRPARTHPSSGPARSARSRAAEC